jgi:hypothetical protein
MTARGPRHGDQHPSAQDDPWCWQQAELLRREHPGWVIIWQTLAAEFRAYGRLPGARRGTALVAGTPTRLAALIGQVEQATRHAPQDRKK